MVLPLVLVVALALVQAVLLGRDAVLVAQAARDAAREAAVSSADGAVLAAALGTGLREDRVALRIERAGRVGGPVTARLRYRAPVAIPFLDRLLPDVVEVTASVTMRQEVP